jgi:DNA-binding MarR family transcriptional regulator
LRLGTSQFGVRAIANRLSVCQLRRMSRRTPTGQRLTELILETFRLNGALLSRGDGLVEDIGLTSARWQLLGAVALEGRPLSVAQIARRMGLSRQAVQRVANDLHAAGLTAYRGNPDHKRAKLVALTKQGEMAYARADARQSVWVNGIGKGLDPARVVDALRLLRLVHDRCREGGDAGRKPPTPRKTRWRTQPTDRSRSTQSKTA